MIPNSDSPFEVTLNPPHSGTWNLMESPKIRHDTVEWRGVSIPYSWCHSRRRTLGITVRPDKSISVRVPLRTSLKQIREFVTQRAEWVLRIWNKLDARPVRQQQGYDSGAIFMYQGKEFRLAFETGRQLCLKIQGNFLVLTSPELPSEETVRRLIEKWYRKQALEIVKERSIECHRMMLGEGIPLPPITIRTMKTRWGSYSYKTRRICLNLNLIKAPQACLDYVIIHELCHIKVRHHGADFWQMVSRYCPDYLSERRQLKQHT